MAKKTTIRCPHCNTEYLPGEIYYPNAFVGQPTHIIKDPDGNVLGFDGDDMQTEEVFTCEKCGKQFKVDASVTFKTEPVHDIFDDGDEFVAKLED